MMERFLDIHLYITAALEKTDMRAVGLQLAMDLLYEKVKQKDIWSCLLKGFLDLDSS